MNTIFNIYTTLGTAFITSGTIDLYDNIPISINYNIADIKEPDKRHADYSKTIKLPGTNNNNNLLSHIYEIGIDRLYNPNKKVEARIFSNGIQILKGFMKLDKIHIIEGKKQYDVTVQGKTADLLTSIIDKKLSDINWSNLDHTYSSANQIASWYAPTGVGYVYPFIDYGYSIDQKNYDVINFFPALYVKEIWDRIFSYAGFQYSSTFITSAFFKSLIIPFNSDKFNLTSAQINARQFKASRLTTDQTYVMQTSGTVETPTIIFNNDTTGTNEDGGNNYNIITGEYIVPANGHYNFTCSGIQVYGAASPAAPNQHITKEIYSYSRITKNGVATALASAETLHMGFPDPLYSTIQLSPTHVMTPLVYSAYLVAGDIIKADLSLRLNPIQYTEQTPKNVNYSVIIIADVDASFYAQVNPKIVEGDTVVMANAIAQETKMSDFLVSIIKAFNLYIEYDKDTPNKLLIEDRNSFYNSIVQDWSSKLDISKDLEIIPMGALDAKNYKFTYKPDGDYFNKLYSNGNIGTDGLAENYGQRIKDVDNDFLKNQNKVELIFSPTPLYSDAASNRFYSKIIQVDGQGKATPRVSNIRLLMFNGLKTCVAWTYQSITGSISPTSYPYAGHIDDPTTPTVDINFGIPKEVYYTPTYNATYTNNNLYNKYWKQFIDEITDKNSSIVIGYFLLHPSDIMQVDFRHLYYFKDQYFRLNKIYDYNPIEQGLTKCEFIKLKSGIPFVPSTTVLNFSADGAFDGGDVPPRQTFANIGSKLGGNNLLTSISGNSIMGKDNNVAATAIGVYIIGSNNVVGELSNNINISNSSGITVLGGLVNVSVFNSSGVTVTESNTIIENGIIISSPSTGTGAYLEYSVLLTQSGTNAPVATILFNTLGTVTPSRSSAGNYLFTSSGLFTASKTTWSITGLQGTVTTVSYSTTSIIQMNVTVGGVDSDSSLTNTPFTIKVYQ